MARYDGAKFIAILPRADDAGAEAVAERVRRAVSDLGIANAKSASSPTVTVSIGVATAQPSPPEQPASLVAMAARRLADASRLGRNRWVGAPASERIRPDANRTSASPLSVARNAVRKELQCA